VSRQKKEEKNHTKGRRFTSENNFAPKAKRNKYSLDLCSTLCQDKVEKENGEVYFVTYQIAQKSQV